MTLRYFGSSSGGWDYGNGDADPSHYSRNAAQPDLRLLDHQTMRVHEPPANGFLNGTLDKADNVFVRYN
jgi:hypothetical protein